MNAHLVRLSGMAGDVLGVGVVHSHGSTPVLPASHDHSAPDHEGRICLPAPGQPVWMLINDQPELVYFVKWSNVSSECVIAFDQTLALRIARGEARGGTWMNSASFWALESDLLLARVKGQESAVRHAQKELDKLRAALGTAIKKERGISA